MLISDQLRNKCETQNLASETSEFAPIRLSQLVTTSEKTFTYMLLEFFTTNLGLSYSIQNEYQRKNSRLRFPTVITTCMTALLNRFASKWTGKILALVLSAYG
jgi:hypothetical protein